MDDGQVLSAAALVSTLVLSMAVTKGLCWVEGGVMEDSRRLIGDDALGSTARGRTLTVTSHARTGQLAQFGHACAMHAMG